MESFVIIKILFLTALSFVLAISWTPLLTHFLYKYNLGKHIRDDGSSPIMTALHKAKEGTPTMGGVLVWVTVLMLAVSFFYLEKLFPAGFWGKLNFLTRAQTLLPLGALVTSGVVGLLDDWLNARKKAAQSGGLSIKHRLFLYTFIAFIGALWFYFKLDWDLLHIPFWGNLNVGIWYIPIFMFVIVATSFSVNEIDGLDGLAGGTLMSSFTVMGAIAFVMGKYDLAAFCGVIIGALLAFLWFNINPARFFMGDTGSMSMGIALGIVVMLTNTALFLPIIGFLFVVESLSVIIQVVSKKLRRKKFFLSTPIHHHFEAKGWSEPKIVMRFWVISWVSAVIGLMLFLLERGI